MLWFSIKILNKNSECFSWTNMQKFWTHFDFACCMLVLDQWLNKPGTAYNVHYCSQVYCRLVVQSPFTSLKQLVKNHHYISVTPYITQRSAFSLPQSFSNCSTEKYLQRKCTFYLQVPDRWSIKPWQLLNSKSLSLCFYYIIGFFSIFTKKIWIHIIKQSYWDVYIQ